MLCFKGLKAISVDETFGFVKMPDKEDRIGNSGTWGERETHPRRQGMSNGTGESGRREALCILVWFRFRGGR